MTGRRETPNAEILMTDRPSLVATVVHAISPMIYGCDGAECVYPDNENCECARIAKAAIEAARTYEQR